MSIYFPVYALPLHIFSGEMLINPRSMRTINPSKKTENRTDTVMAATSPVDKPVSKIYANFRRIQELI